MEKTGLHRDTIDKFYTRPAVVEACIQMFQKHVLIDIHDLIIEPSAGNGAFIEKIKSLASNVLFLDLQPEHDEIIQQDYLAFDYSNIKKKYKKIHVMGNPPFGRQSSIAIKFIKKSCEFCDSLSFILPKSFKKDSLKRIFPLYFHMAHEADLPEKSFMLDNIEYDVPCIFQIWIKRTSNRSVVERVAPLGFEFVDKPDAHISFRRVGANAGAIDTSFHDKSPQSHYFIRFTRTDSIPDILHRLSRAQFDNDNTVGPRSISKQELIYQFNRLV